VGSKEKPIDTTGFWWCASQWRREKGHGFLDIREEINHNVLTKSIVFREATQQFLRRKSDE